jgi:tetratricopeptide (TPR) repeat protein
MIERIIQVPLILPRNELDRFSLLEATLLNNQGVNSLAAGRSDLAIECFAAAVSCTNQGNGDRNASVLANTKPGVLVPMEISGLQDGSPYYIYNNAFLVDPFRTDVSALFYSALFNLAVAYQNAGLAFPQEAQSKNDMAVRFYTLLVELIENGSPRSPLGAALSAAASNNLACIQMNFYEDLRGGAGLLRPLTAHIDLLKTSSSIFLMEQLKQLAMNVFAAQCSTHGETALAA